MIISDDERAVLDAIPKHGGEARDVRVEGISPQKRSRLLKKMEEKGLVEREPNPHGPETPWWWVKLPGPEDEAARSSADREGDDLRPLLTRWQAHGFLRVQRRG